ncbi:MAG TPA: ATP-binding cassette domain-containing protein, partial [Candidatus Korarchaeota archaeon]|nr:ATP-binding cassette domain-containing protein [Candidatus Korarchaeota archaeon]
MELAEPVIRVEGLKWKYEGSRDWVLKGVDLEIHQGEFVGIVGPNDSGKTTLAMSLNGLVPNNYPGAMQGRVVVDGMDTREHSVAEIA